MDAPKGYTFDSNSGLYYLEEEGVEDHKPVRIISWFDPKDGSINKVSYPAEEKTSEDIESEQVIDKDIEIKNQNNIPDGYMPYPGTNLYYVSKNIKNDNGDDIQQVTYFDPVTEEYNAVDYPLENEKVTAPPPKPEFSAPPPPKQNVYVQQKQPKKTKPIVIVAIVVVVLAIAGTGIGMAINKTKNLRDIVNDNSADVVQKNSRDENIILGTGGSKISDLELEVVAYSKNECTMTLNNIAFSNKFPAPKSLGINEDEIAFDWRIDIGEYAIMIAPINSQTESELNLLRDFDCYLWKKTSTNSYKKTSVEFNCVVFPTKLVFKNMVLPEEIGIDISKYSDYRFSYKYAQDRGSDVLKSNVRYEQKATTTEATTTQATTTQATTTKKTTAKKTTASQTSNYYGTYGGGEMGKITLNKSGNFTMTINTGFGYATAAGRAFWAPGESMVYLYVDNNFNGFYGFTGDNAGQIALKKSGNTLTLVSPGQLGLMSSGLKFKK